MLFNMVEILTKPWTNMNLANVSKGERLEFHFDYVDIIVITDTY